MRALNTIRYDILFQLRHGFYSAYLAVTAIYIVALLNMQGMLRNTFTTILLFTDTVMLGFFFIGAIILLEKSQNTLESIFITPLKLTEYLFSKVISLTLIAVLSGFAIILIVCGIFDNFIYFLFGLILSSICYTLLGLIFAAKAKNVNDYFVKSMAGSMLLILPVLGHLNIFQSPLFYFFPTNATLLLFKAPFMTISTQQLFYSFSCLIIWIVILAIIAYKRFHKHIILKTGTGR